MYFRIPRGKQRKWTRYNHNCTLRRHRRRCRLQSLVGTQNHSKGVEQGQGVLRAEIDT